MENAKTIVEAVLVGALMLVLFLGMSQHDRDQ